MGDVYRGILTLMIVLACSFSAGAANVPGWMNAAPAEDQSGPDKDKLVWLVVTDESNNEGKLGPLRVVSASLFLGNREFLYDFNVVLKKDGETFRFDRKEIAFLRFYTNASYSLGGAPTYYSYRPRIVLRSGDEINDGWESVFPQGALRPDRYRFDQVKVVELYGQRREKTETTNYSRPVLAMAWSRADAERVRDEIIVRYAQNEANRTEIPWGANKKVYTPKGPANVTVRADYKMKTTGRYSDWCETTVGTVTLTIDGRDQVHDYRHHCCDSIHSGGNPNRFCPPSGPRTDFWSNDSTGTFEKIYVGPIGATVWSGTGAKPERADQVDLSVVNVGFRLEVPK